MGRTIILTAGYNVLRYSLRLNTEEAVSIFKIRVDGKTLIIITYTQSDRCTILHHVVWRMSCLCPRGSRGGRAHSSNFALRNLEKSHHTNKKKSNVVDFNTFQLFVCHISNRLVRSLHFSLSVWTLHAVHRWSKAPVQINYAHRQFRGGEALTKKPRSHRTDRVLLLAASRSQTRIEPDCDPATTCSSDTLKWIDSTGFLWPVRLWEETQSEQTSSPKTAPRSFLKTQTVYQMLVLVKLLRDTTSPVNHKISPPSSPALSSPEH